GFERERNRSTGRFRIPGPLPRARNPETAGAAVEGPEVPVVAIDLQAFTYGLHGHLPVIHEERRPRQVEVVFRLVELKLDCVAAELQSICRPSLAPGDPIPQVGVVETRNVRAPGLGDLTQE